MSQQVMLTIPEFACLAYRNESYIRQQLEDGKIKGYQTCKGSAWRIPESELSRWSGEPGMSDLLEREIKWALELLESLSAG